MTPKIPCYIITFNRLTCTKKLADWLAATDGVYPVIVDNNSTYEPLLEYYKTTPHQVIRMDANYAECCIWSAPGMIEKLNLKDGNYMISDCDIDPTGIPSDFLDVMKRVLAEQQPWCEKVGLALRIDDLPDNEITREVIKHENGQWANPLGNDVYKAATDTTFCLLKNSVHSFESVRIGGAYQVRHTPWYFTDLASMPSDEIYYMKSLTGTSSHWTKKIKAQYGL